jgi:AcrR family transcriptional regulator
MVRSGNPDVVATLPDHDGSANESITSPSVAERSVQRALENRRSSYSDEVGRLIHAAVTLVQTSPAANPTISVGETIAEAGLSNQAFYRHFQNKDEFLLAILDNGLRAMLRYLEHELAKAQTPVDTIRRWIRGVLTQAIRSDVAAMTRGVLCNSGHLMYTTPEEFQRCEEMIERPLRVALEEAVRAGEIAPLDLDRDVRAIYRLTMGSMEVALARAVPPTDDDVEHLVQFIFRALELRDESTA